MTFQFLAPVEVAPSTGATALYAHHVSDNSHKDASNKRHQHIPEKVQHGQTSFTGGLPRKPSSIPFTPAQSADTAPPFCHPAATGFFVAGWELCYTTPSCQREIPLDSLMLGAALLAYKSQKSLTDDMLSGLSLFHAAIRN